MLVLVLSLSVPELRLLLRGGGLGLGGLLPVAPDHDDAQEGADDGGAQQDQDHGYADGPLARGEEAVERVIEVDEGHCQRPDRVVQEDDGGGHEHGEADESPEHCQLGSEENKAGGCDE